MKHQKSEISECTQGRNITSLMFEFEHCESQEEVRKHIQECEGKHTQQVAYSSFHDCLTQICWGCLKVRSNKR